MGLWSVFLVWLWVTGDMTRYLGPRTYWVVPFGALTLGLAATALLLPRPPPSGGAPSGASHDSGGMSRSEAAGLVVLAIPILAVLAVPGAELGALAASNKSTSGLLSGVAAAVPTRAAGDEVSFIDIHYASQSEGYAATRGIAAGMEVGLTGFVTSSPEVPDGMFQLTRFYVSCCAADAIPYSVPVELPAPVTGSYPDDQWLRVKGTLASSADGFYVAPEAVTKVKTPTDPYLY